MIPDLRGWRLDWFQIFQECFLKFRRANIQEIFVLLILINLSKVPQENGLLPQYGTQTRPRLQQDLRKVEQWISSQCQPQCLMSWRPLRSRWRRWKSRGVESTFFIEAVTPLQRKRHQLQYDRYDRQHARYVCQPATCHQRIKRHQCWHRVFAWFEIKVYHARERQACWSSIQSKQSADFF